METEKHFQFKLIIIIIAITHFPHPRYKLQNVFLYSAFPSVGNLKR